MPDDQPVGPSDSDVTTPDSAASDVAQSDLAVPERAAVGTRPVGVIRLSLTLAPSTLPPTLRPRLTVSMFVAFVCLGLVVVAGLYASHTNPIKIYPAGLCSVAQGLGCPVESGAFWVPLDSAGTQGWRFALSSDSNDAKWVWNKTVSLMSGNAMFMVSFDFRGLAPATQTLVSTDAITGVKILTTMAGRPTYNSTTTKNDNTFKIGLGLYSGGKLQSQYYASCTGADTAACAPDLSYRLASSSQSNYTTPSITTNFVTGKAWLYSELQSVVAIIQQTDNLGSLLYVERLRMEVTAGHPVSLSLTNDAPYLSKRGVDPLAGGLQSYAYRVVVTHGAGVLVSRVRVCLNKNPCGTVSDPGWVTMAPDLTAGDTTLRDGDFLNGEQFLISYNGFAGTNLNSTQTYYFEAEDPAGRTNRLPIANALPSVYFGPALLVSYASVQLHPSGLWLRPTLGSLWSFCGEPDCGTDQGIGAPGLYSTALDLDDGDDGYAWTTQGAAILSMALESVPPNARGLFQISGVQARAVASDEGVLTSFRLGFRIADTNFLVSVPMTDGGGGFADYAGTLYSLNPGNGLAWTWTDLDSLVVLVSQTGPGTAALRVTELTADVYLGSVIHPSTINALSSTANCCATPTPAGTSWTSALDVHDYNVRYVTVGGGTGGLQSTLYLDLQAPAASIAGPYISYVQVGVVANVATLASFRFGIRSKGKDFTRAVTDRENVGYKTYLSRRYEVDPATNRQWTWDDIRKLVLVIAPNRTTAGTTITVTEAYLLVNDSPIRLGFAGESGLTTDGVEPNTGTTATRFTFKTLYTHTNNVAPNLALFSVVIDGGRLTSSFNLAQLLVSSTKNDGNFSNGELYSATVTGAQLGTGSHTYYFLVSDLGTPSATTRLPASGVFNGPSVDTGSGYLNLWPLKSWEGSAYSSLNWQVIGLQSTALDTNNGDATLISTTGTSLQSLWMQMDVPPIGSGSALTSETISFVMINAVARDDSGSATFFRLGLCSTACANPRLRSLDLGHRTPGDGLYHLYTSPPFTGLVSTSAKAWTWDAIASLVTIIERRVNWPPLYVTQLYATVGLAPAFYPSGPASTDPGTWTFAGTPATALATNDGNSTYASHQSAQDTQPNDKLSMDFNDPTQSGFFIEGVQMTALAAGFDANGAGCGPGGTGTVEGIAVGLQIGGADFMELASVTGVSPNDGVGPYQPFTTALYRTNPATKLAWTWDDIKDLVGVAHHTSTCDIGKPGELRVTEMNLVVLYSPTQLSLPGSTLASFAADAVDPDGGSTLTSFMYKVVYTNNDNRPPLLISLRIDGGTTLSSLFSLQRDSSATGALGDGNFANGELYSYYPVLFSSYGAHTYQVYASDRNDNLTLDSQANRNLTFLPVSPAEALTGPLVSVGAACIGPNCTFGALHPSDKNALTDSGWGLGAQTLLWPTALDTNDGNTSLASSCTSGDDLYLDMDDPDPGLASFYIDLVSVTILANNNAWTGCSASANTGFRVGIVTTGVLGGETPLVSLAVNGATYLASTALWSVGPGGPRWSWDQIKTAQIHVAHNDGKPLRVTEAYLSVNTSPIGLSFSQASGYKTDGVDPNGGLASLTSFVFRVVYANTNNVAPTLVSVRIDGDTLGSAMTLETVGVPNYQYGALYSYQGTACFPASASCRLYPGLHSYFFEAQAGGITAVWPLGATSLISTSGISGPAIQSLTLVPLLSYAPQGGFGDQDLVSDTDGINGQGVHPNRGLLTTLFSFKVVYTSPNNIAPSFVRLHVDGDTLSGSPFTMTQDTLASNALYRDGQYANSEQFTTVLLSFQDSPKTHTYYFTASDLVSTLRLPATSTQIGPLVSDVLVSTTRLHPTGACTTSGTTACPGTTWTTVGGGGFATVMDTRDNNTTYAQSTASGRRMFLEMDDPAFTNTAGLRIESVAVTAVATSNNLISWQLGVCLSTCTIASGKQLWSTIRALNIGNLNTWPGSDCGVTNTWPPDGTGGGCLTEFFASKPGGGRWKVEDIANTRALVSHLTAPGGGANRTFRITELYLTVTFTNTLSLDFCTAAANCAETGYGANDGVDPNAGPSPSNFTYKAVYSHGSNVAPNLISVGIDGRLYSMVRDAPCTATGGLMRDCDYTNGELYSLTSVGMTAGLHSYYFTATAGASLDSLPDDGTRLYGPGSTANAPTLASAWVEPVSGLTGVSYSFRLLYSDADNDPPLSLKVFLDGDTGGRLMSRDTTTASNNSATLSNGRYDDGELFSLGLPMFQTLGIPQHTFYFEATDGRAVPIRYPFNLASLISSSHPAGCAQYSSQPKGVFCGPQVTDAVRPQSIEDLEIYDRTLDTVALQWTSPGNDTGSAAGFVSQYEIRFSTLRIVDDGLLNSFDPCPSKTLPDSLLPRDLKSIRPSEVLFCHVADDPNRAPQTSYGGFSGVIDALKLPQPPTPAEGGTIQTFTITNLNPNTAYYIAIRGRDQSGYLSSLVSAGVVNSSRVGPGATDNLPPDPGTKLRTGFGMLSMPLAPSPSAVEAALGDRLGTPLEMHLWIPSGEANDAGVFSKVSNLAAGKAYFAQPSSESPSLLRATSDDGTAKGSLVTTAACPGGMPGGNCFIIQLSSGWNPIGNPFVEEMRLDSTYLRSSWTGSGPLYSLASAVVAGWIGQSGTLFEWVGDKYDGQTYNALDTVTGAPSGAARLRPWRGYFLQALASGNNYLGSYDFIIRQP